MASAKWFMRCCDCRITMWLMYHIAILIHVVPFFAGKKKLVIRHLKELIQIFLCSSILIIEFNQHMLPVYTFTSAFPFSSCFIFTVIMQKENLYCPLPPRWTVVQSDSGRNVCLRPAPNFPSILIPLDK